MVIDIEHTKHVSWGLLLMKIDMGEAHLSTLRTKMARYIGIMYKLKRILPLKFENWNTNITYQLLFSSLGFCAKSHIEIILMGSEKGNEGRNSGLNTVLIQRWSHCWTHQSIF